jgi:hypothetical protein
VRERGDVVVTLEKALLEDLYLVLSGLGTLVLGVGFDAEGVEFLGGRWE